MTLFRRLTVFSRRTLAARAGFLAFVVSLAMGLGLGLSLGSAAPRQARRKAEMEMGEALASAGDLRRGLTERHNALDLVARVPSVVERKGAEAKAFAALRGMYPEFVEIRIETTVGEGSAEPSPVHSGPHRLRLSSRIPGGGVLVGVLAQDWPNRVVAQKGRFGTDKAGLATVVVAPSGTRTEGTLAPPAWRRLSTLADSRFAVANWGEGESMLTSVRRLPRRRSSSSTHGLDLAVVVGVPMARIAAESRRVQGIALGFGLFLGLVAGAVAWVGVARSTRRLRNVNATLEARVAARTSELAAAERSFRTLFENAPFGLYQCDAEGRFVRVNPTLAHTLGYANPEALIESLGSLQALGDPTVRSRFLDLVRQEGEAEATMLASGAFGRPTWLTERARVVEGENGEVLMIEGAVHDVTAQREVEEQLRRMGATDPLTGLLNRRGLEEAIGAAESPVSFVTLDVDRFKVYNDTFGHVAGDSALRAVAEAIRRTVRSGDAVARAGGEEFVVVLSRTGPEGARRVAEALREAVAACLGLEAPVTVSGGVATAEAPERLDEAFAAADRALYRAKESGRDRIVVNAATLA